MCTQSVVQAIGGGVCLGTPAPPHEELSPGQNGHRPSKADLSMWTAHSHSDFLPICCLKGLVVKKMSWSF